MQFKLEDDSALNGVQHLVYISFTSEGNSLIFTRFWKIFHFCTVSSIQSEIAVQIILEHVLSIEWGSTSNHYFIHIKWQFHDIHMILNTFPLLHCFLYSKWDSNTNQIRTCFSIECWTTSNHHFIHIRRHFFTFFHDKTCLLGR